MNLVSRIISGTILITLGLFLFLLPFSFSFKNGGFVSLIFGIIILVLGILVLFNTKEDNIEQIKSRRKK